MKKSRENPQNRVENFLRYQHTYLPPYLSTGPVNYGSYRREEKSRKHWPLFRQASALSHCNIFCFVKLNHEQLHD